MSKHSQNFTIKSELLHTDVQVIHYPEIVKVYFYNVTQIPKIYDNSAES